MARKKPFLHSKSKYNLILERNQKNYFLLYEIQLTLNEVWVELILAHYVVRRLGAELLIVVLLVVGVVRHAHLA